MRNRLLTLVILLALFAQAVPLRALADDSSAEAVAKEEVSSDSDAVVLEPAAEVVAPVIVEPAAEPVPAIVPEPVVAEPSVPSVAVTEPAKVPSPEPASVAIPAVDAAAPVLAPDLPTVVTVPDEVAPVIAPAVPEAPTAIVPAPAVEVPSEQSVAVPAADPSSDQAVAPEDEGEEDEDEDVLSTDNEADADLFKNFEGVVRQSQPYTCGPAALATLLTQLDASTTEADVLAYAPADVERGVTLLALRDASVGLGHDAILKRWAVDQLSAYLGETGNPVLIHDVKPNVGGHFSVVREIAGDAVTLSDTEAGNITYSLADFAVVFDGAVLIADPDRGSALVVDSSTDLSDAEAAEIWGKYVPVAIAAYDHGDRTDALAFARCMKDAAAVSNAAQRHAKQDRCYADLGAGVQDASFVNEALISLDANAASVFTGVGLDLLKDLQYTIDPTFVTLSAELVQANDAQNRAGSAVTSALAAVGPAERSFLSAKDAIKKVTDSNAVTAGKKADYERQISDKNATMSAAQSQIGGAKLQLGSIAASIAAATSNLGSLSRAAQAKMSSAKGQVASKQATVRSLGQEILSRQASVVWVGVQVAGVKSAIAFRSAFRLSVSSQKQQLAKLQNQMAAEQQAVFRAKSSRDQLYRDIAYLQGLIDSGADSIDAGQAAVDALKRKERLAKDDLARKQDQLPRIQADIDALSAKIRRLPAPQYVDRTAYDIANAAYGARLSAYNAARAEYNSAVSRVQVATRAISDEKAFIDKMEQRTDRAIAADVRNDSKPAASFAVSLIPIVGEGYDLLTLIGGKDPITRENLSPFGKVLTVVGLCSGVGSGKAARSAGELALAKVAKDLNVSFDELLPIAESVAKEYKIASVDDIVALKGELSLDSFMGKVRAAAKGIKNVASTSIADDVVQLTEDAWILNWSKRGFLIDNALGNNLGATFKGVDILENRTVISIKSLDINAATYQDASKLTSKLKGYVKSLADEDKFGKLKAGIDFDGKALKLGIPDAMISSAQAEAISVVRSYADDLGIALSIVIVK